MEDIAGGAIPTSALGTRTYLTWTYLASPALSIRRAIGAPHFLVPNRDESWFCKVIRRFGIIVGKCDALQIRYYGI